MLNIAIRKRIKENLVELQMIFISFDVFSVYSNLSQRICITHCQKNKVSVLKKLVSPCASNLILPFIDTEFGNKAGPLLSFSAI